uniref:Uncharacterized protein n=1 Tax=Solanum lycopersicum TaxID=4081 RepID=A0A3Q7J8T3_SOLLC
MRQFFSIQLSSRRPDSFKSLIFDIKICDRIYSNTPFTSQNYVKEFS